jgi:hypothetical protein
VPSLHRERREHRHRLELVASAAPLLAGQVFTRSPDEVGQEKRVELRRLGELRELAPKGEVGPAAVAAISPMAPGLRVVAEALKKDVEDELSTSSGHASPCAAMMEATRVSYSRRCVW